MQLQNDSEAPWYVLYTQPHKEFYVYSLVTDQEKLPAYLPEVRQKYRGRVQMRPLFPRYLFVQLAWTEVAVVNHVPGAIKLVSIEGKPLPLRPGVVQALREEVARLNAAGGLPTQAFREGDLVRLRSGPLAGMEAVFVKHLTPHDRAIVLLRFLGQENQVEVDLSALERKSRPHRRTRGRGRKIQHKKGAKS